MKPLSRRQFLQAAASLSLGTAIGVADKSQALTSLAPTDELVEFDALGLARLIKRGEVSSREVVETVIRRIERFNPILNFMTTPDFTRALERVESISPDTTFAGVPLLVKDMIDVGGVRRTDGSRLNVNNVPVRNVDYVDGVEEAGFNILGMTNVPEFASLIVTDNDLFGATKNPWRLDLSVGSSSGGSAAAVCAGVVPIAHGTDGAGSCRLPPCLTGLLGMKPSRFRMRSGESNGGHDPAKTNQMISRSVRDSAAAFSHTEDRSGSVFKPVGFVTGPSSRRLTVAIALDSPGLIPVNPEVREAQMKVGRLLESMGHTVVESSYPVDAERFYHAYNAFFANKAKALKGAVEAVSGRPLMESGLLTRFLASNVLANSSLDDSFIANGLAFLDTIPNAFEQLFNNCDVMMTPCCPVTAIALSEASPDDLFTDERARFTLGRLKFLGPVNFGGNPAMSVPLSWSEQNGLPIGSHFIAKHGDDRTLYELAYELEEARGWADQWAPCSTKRGIGPIPGQSD